MDEYSVDFPAIWVSFRNSGVRPERIVNSYGAFIRSFGHPIPAQKVKCRFIFRSDSIGAHLKHRTRRMRAREKWSGKRSSSSGLICNEATVNNQHRYDMKNPIYFVSLGIFEFRNSSTSHFNKAKNGAEREREKWESVRAFNAMINRMVFAGFSMEIASRCVLKPSIMVLHFRRKLLGLSGSSRSLWQSGCSQSLIFALCGSAARAHMNSWKPQKPIRGYINLTSDFQNALALSIAFPWTCAMHVPTVFRIEMHQFLHHLFKMQYQIDLKLKFQRLNVLHYIRPGAVYHMHMKFHEHMNASVYWLHFKTNNKTQCNHISVSKPLQ